jgi:acylphosphatase
MSDRPRDRNAEALRVRILGRVQGVGFRYWTREQAQSLGISGWVRNEPDGSVTALIAGAPDAVGAMLERLRQGPAGSRVVELLTERATEQDLEGEFQILS